MSEEEISHDPNYVRGKYLLDNRMHTVYDLFRYWMIAANGPSGPPPERRTPWWEDFHGIFTYKYR